MGIDQCDLELLRVIHQLMTERRVSSMAEMLGMSQPAVSGALRRLLEAVEASRAGSHDVCSFGA